MRRPWRATVGHRSGLGAVLALLTLAGAAAGTRAQDGAEGYALEIGATTCDQAPARLPQLAEAGCVAAVGVAIEVRTEGGERLGGCVTEAPADGGPVAACVVSVPYDTAVFAFEEASTLPAGYAPLEEPLFERTPPLGVTGLPPQFFINVPAAAPPPAAPIDGDAPAAVPAASQDGDAVPVRPVAIVAGGCGDGELGEVVAALTDLSAPQGEPVGPATATAAEASFTSVPIPLAELVAQESSIAVSRSGDEGDELVACGEVGGAFTANGNLAFGLDEVDGSGFTGVAYLSPNADDPSLTDVLVFLVERRNEEVNGTPVAA